MFSFWGGETHTSAHVHPSVWDFPIPKVCGQRSHPLLHPPQRDLEPESCNTPTNLEILEMVSFAISSPLVGMYLLPKAFLALIWMERTGKERFGQREVRSRTRRAECLLMIKNQRSSTYINSFFPLNFFSLRKAEKSIWRTPNAGRGGGGH